MHIGMSLYAPGYPRKEDRLERGENGNFYIFVEENDELREFPRKEAILISSMLTRSDSMKRLLKTVFLVCWLGVLVPMLSQAQTAKTEFWKDCGPGWTAFSPILQS